jgi:hypothetical protein
MRGDQEKQTGKTTRRSRLVRGKDQSLQAEEALGDGQVEKSRQAVWNPEKGERDPLRRFSSSIASQPLVP